MLAILFLDPIIQNLTLYCLLRFVFASIEEGGCCHDQKMRRATWIFVTIYVLGTLLAGAVCSIGWMKILALPPVGSQNSRIHLFVMTFWACIFNMHLFVFGFVPKWHSYFEMQEIIKAVKGSLIRNAAQNFTMFTVIGMLSMNLLPYEQFWLVNALLICLIQVVFNIAQFIILSQ